MTSRTQEGARSAAVRLASVGRGSRSRTWRLFAALSLVVPLLVVYVAVLIASGAGASVNIQTRYALVNLVIVVGLQLFSGNSGVLSFGHIAFVAVGAWTMGLLSISPVLKQNILPDIFPFLAKAQAGTLTALLLAAAVGGLLALVVAPFLMRLDGLQAGIATFALLGVVTQVLTYWTRIAPPSGQSLVGIPKSIDLQMLLLLALGAIVVSWLYSRSRSARLLRASREDGIAAPGVGINTTLHRVIAFGLSGVVCGVGGAMFAVTNTVLQASQLSVGFTFTIIAMLVLGGTQSVWGAVVGTLVYSLLDGVLLRAQSGLTVGNLVFTLPESLRPVLLGLLVVAVLILRPSGLTGGREAGVPGWLRRGSNY